MNEVFIGQRVYIQIAPHLGAMFVSSDVNNGQVQIKGANGAGYGSASLDELEDATYLSDADIKQLKPTKNPTQTVKGGPMFNISNYLDEIAFGAGMKDAKSFKDLKVRLMKHAAEIDRVINAKFWEDGKGAGPTPADVVATLEKIEKEQKD